jgi:hypothetical protein
MVTGFEWTGGGNEIATILIPDDRASRPVESRMPAGPNVKITEDGENMLRTYASLMANPYDEALLEWHATGQLAVIEVEDRRVTEIGTPQMITSFDFAPDGRHARVEIMQQPFSYVVPVRSFASVEQIWDREGAMLAVLQVNELENGIDGNLPTAPGVGGNDDEPERRDVAWRQDGAGLTFLLRTKTKRTRRRKRTARRTAAGPIASCCGPRPSTARASPSCTRARRASRRTGSLPITGCCS